MVSARVFSALFGKNTLAPDIVDRFGESSRITVTAKGEMVYETGVQQNEEVLFLLKGLVRTFIYKPDGSEFTDGFVWRKGQLIIGYTEGLELSPMNVEALKETEVLRIPFAAVEDVLAEHPDFYRELLVRMSELLKRSMQERMMLQNSVAYDRLKWLERQYPGLIDAAPNGYIASYLNMTPVTLSRMRRKMREERTGGLI